jgi:osmotically-inducible protein OsmY
MHLSAGTRGDPARRRLDASSAACRFHRVKQESSMKRTEELQRDVLDELAYDTAVDSSQIAVTATASGVITLTGSVPTYMQARAAERAAKRIRGVNAVASKLDVNLPTALARGDTGIAEAALRALEWSASVPDGAVRVTVTNGWITLEGKVDWEYQRRAAQQAVRDLAGVRGVTNLVELTPYAKPTEIRAKIEEAFRRSAEIDAQHVIISTTGGRVTLSGTVHSLAEKEAAERAALAAVGVSSVVNDLEVRAHAFA